MADIGYLLGRLPPLVVDATHLPIGPEEFSDLMMDAELGFWAAGLLDWLRLANQLSAGRNLPPPYPDASAVPRLAWPDNPWAAYYARFTAISAPAIVRDWTLEDSALLEARAAARGRRLGITERTLHRNLEGLVHTPTPEPAPAAARDLKTLTFHFRWLDERVFSSGPESFDRILAYAIKLLVITRNGRRLAHARAA